MWQNIDMYIGIVIMTIGVYFFARITIKENKKISDVQLLLLIFTISLIHTWINIELSGILKTTVVCIINIIFYKYTFKISIKKSVFITFLYMIILMLTELLELFFLTKILGMSKVVCYEIYAGSLLSNILVCTLFLILTILIKKLYQKLINEKLENNKRLVILLILTFACLGMFFNIIIKEFRFNDNVLIYIFSIIILIIMIM